MNKIDMANELKKSVDEIRKAYSNNTTVMACNAVVAVVLIFATLYSLFSSIGFAVNYENYIQDYVVENEKKDNRKDEKTDAISFDDENKRPMIYGFVGTFFLAILSGVAVLTYYTALRQRGRCMEMLNEHRKYLEKLHTISLIESDGEKHRLYAKLIEK